VLNVGAPEVDHLTVSRPRRAVRARWAAALLIVALAVVTDATITQDVEPAASTSAASTVTTPCGWRSTAPARYDHVIWVVLENHSFEDLIGPAGSPARTGSPYLNTLADRCGLATNYWGITHPSLPNYLALVSGRTGGVTTSCTPTGCPQRRETLMSQLTARGRAWRVYAESMGQACRRSDSYPYVVRHNPPTYFPALAGQCLRRDLPMGSLTGGRLVTDLATDAIPSFSLLVPNQCNNGHDCPSSRGDAWLSKVVPKILASPDYRQGHTALFVTWDEGAGGSHGQNCAATRDRSCHVVTVVVSPTTRPGTTSARHYDHYALLETTERMFGIPPLGHAADASTINMRTAFGL
jgi:phosphatidylinositol-3-phosphatase